MLLLGKRAQAGFLIILVCIFAILSKDNPKITSSVAAINREKKDRIENFFTQISVIGAALVFIGGFASHNIGDIHFDENTNINVAEANEE